MKGAVSCCLSLQYEIMYNAWKIGIYTAHMGGNKMRAVCTYTSAKRMAELF